MKVILGEKGLVYQKMSGHQNNSIVAQFCSSFLIQNQVTKLSTTLSIEGQQIGGAMSGGTNCVSQKKNLPTSI